ncbi:MAG: hypothetical protein CM15mP120_09470 [Pseudomonadota bacterium]|nr:MAG: hypothetical protein CM15mP120_09470 [Pseudomonadota bacterium]
MARSDDVFFLVTEELEEAIAGTGAEPRFGELADQRRAFREACKQHHPPGTLPAIASEIDAVSLKETQIKNDENRKEMRGFAVSSGQVTGKGVWFGPTEFDKMFPGSILVSPLTPHGRSFPTRGPLRMRQHSCAWVDCRTGYGHPGRTRCRRGNINKHGKRSRLTGIPVFRIHGRLTSPTRPIPEQVTKNI